MFRKDNTEMHLGSVLPTDF